MEAVGDDWKQVMIQDKAKYLGFLTGPGRVDDNSTWDKATAKWVQRTQSWAGKGLRLQYSAIVHNVFCASVLSFLGQLTPLPEEILQKEEKGDADIREWPGERG